MCHDHDTEPGQGFKEIVGTRNPIKSIALRNLSHLTARRPQVFQCYMCDKITQKTIKMSDHSHMSNRDIFLSIGKELLTRNNRDRIITQLSDRSDVNWG
jgi:hypothetical protein